MYVYIDSYCNLSAGLTKNALLQTVLFLAILSTGGGNHMGMSTIKKKLV